MDKTRSCVFIGGSGTGKSHLVTSVLHANRDIPAGVVMSGTEEGDPYWRQFVPDLFIYNDWKPEKLEELIEIQKRAKRGIEALDAEIEYCRKHGRSDDLARLRRSKAFKLHKMRKFIIIDDLMFKGGITIASTNVKNASGKAKIQRTMLHTRFSIRVDVAQVMIYFFYVVPFVVFHLRFLSLMHEVFFFVLRSTLVANCHPPFANAEPA